MRAWVLILGGLLIWAVHFFVIYILASLLPGNSLARWLVLAWTAVSLSAAAALFVRASLHLRHFHDGDELQRWMTGLAAGGCLLAAIGVAYQGATAVLS